MRSVWLIFGLASLAIAVIGIFLPLVPTVPLLLLSAFCFSKSSDRLYSWLLAHPKLGPPIQSWRSSGSISRKSKFLAIFSIAVTLGISFVLNVSVLILSIQVIVLAAVSAFIITRPEK